MFIDVPLTSRVPEQNPYFGAGQVVGKALIVCPVSLVNVREPLLECVYDIYMIADSSWNQSGIELEK